MDTVPTMDFATAGCLLNNRERWLKLPDWFEHSLSKLAEMVGQLTRLLEIRWD